MTADGVERRRADPMPPSAVRSGPWTIRLARSDDHEALLRTWRAAVESSHGFLTALDIDGYEPVVARALRLSAGVLVAADAEDRPLGFLQQDGDEVHMLFIAPEAEGRGIGSSLLASAAPSGTVQRLDVNEQNPTARRFYEARGFSVVGRSAVDDQGRPFPLLQLQRIVP